MLDDNADFKTINDAHPHIGTQLKALWGKPEFVSYMKSLTSDTRDGARHGFRGEVFFALHSLSEQHTQAYPDYQVASTLDPWATSVGEYRAT
ncbi:hypothetical protein [Hydrogenophaga sp. OTU3427]|uniref:hypothetical protein n=1 Tax=Hydrogenophaga sp. OTU3427 TaxID=3043856 RepID=UPI00313D7403